MDDSVAPVRCLVADDHPLTRRGIRSALEGAGFEVCGEAANATEAVAAALRERPDICLLDVFMPGNGIRAAEQIRVVVPDTAVVMLTVADDDETLLAAIRAGAVGFLPKDMCFDRLPQALRGVLSGEAAIPRELIRRLLHEFRYRSAVHRTVGGRRPPGSLTSRETDVLDLLAQGLTTAEIASRLFLSHATVRSHAATVLRKFGVENRAALRELLDRDDVRPGRATSP